MERRGNSTTERYWKGQDLTTPQGLEAALDEAGTSAELERQTGIHVNTLKSRGKRLGVRMGVGRGSEATGGGGSRSAKARGQKRDTEDLPAICFEVDSYFEAILEYMDNTGFSGWDVAMGVQDLARDLGLDSKTMVQLGDKAWELARDAHDRCEGRLRQLWDEWGGMTRLLQGGAS